MKTFTSLVFTALFVLRPSSVFAYEDVHAGVWFEEAVQSFVQDGYLDSKQKNFRPTDTAARAEFIKLIIELNGGVLNVPPADPSFDDVPLDAWFYGFFEEAAHEEWVKGRNNCLGTHPCFADPGAPITRAEVMVLLQRSFGFERTGSSPGVSDVDPKAWYADAAYALADHCIVSGDAATGAVRPHASINRAEMVAMLHRVDQGLSYGVDCGVLAD